MPVTQSLPPQTLRRRILDELRSQKTQRLSIVPSEMTADGNAACGVIVTDVGGQRFRILEASGKFTLDQDESPRADTATWHKVFAFATLKAAVGAMLDAMKSS